MQERKKTPSPVLIILLVLTILLGSFIIYNVFYKNRVINESDDYSYLPEWVAYVLEKDLSSITYEYVSNNECVTKEMTKEELVKIIEKMTENSLRKFDMENISFDCNTGITIKYQNKELHLWQGKYIVLDKKNDSIVLSLLEKDITVKEETLNNNPNWVFEYEWDNSYIDTLLKING